jgi:hypothetical protein
MSGHPVAELCQFLAGWALTAKKSRQLGELLGVEAAQTFVPDLVAHERGIAASAYSAEQADLQGIAIVERVTADGKVTPEEVPQLLTALKHFKHSAKKDHEITETANV